MGDALVLIVVNVEGRFHQELHAFSRHRHGGTLHRPHRASPHRLVPTSDVTELCTGANHAPQKFGSAGDGHIIQAIFAGEETTGPEGAHELEHLFDALGGETTVAH